MKGIITRALLVVGAAASLCSTGCITGYRNVVDPCWPERYGYMARQEVYGAFAPQVGNGHVLDQTVWNWHFEPGSDKLHPAGLDHLVYLVRRRPKPDCTVYVQTAHDIAYDPAAPEKFVETRAELDAKRVQAVQKYLTAQTAGRHLDFNVQVHDPAEKDIQAIQAGTSIQRRNASAQGTLTGVTGGGGASGGR
jgi:hypothetical protein